MLHGQELFFFFFFSITLGFKAPTLGTPEQKASMDLDGF